MIVVIPYDRLLAILPPEATLNEAYVTADEVLEYAVRGIVQTVRYGEGCLPRGDFEYLKSFMVDGGLATIMGRRYDFLK